MRMSYGMTHFYDVTIRDPQVSINGRSNLQTAQEAVFQNWFRIYFL